MFLKGDIFGIHGRLAFILFKKSYILQKNFGIINIKTFQIDLGRLFVNYFWYFCFILLQIERSKNNGINMSTFSFYFIFNQRLIY